MTVLFDKMLYVDRLKLGGIDDLAARAHAEALDTALHESVATKADLKEAVAELRGEIAELRGEIAELRTTTRSDLDRAVAELRGEIAELRGEIAELRTTTRSDLNKAVAEVRGEIAELRTDMNMFKAEVDHNFEAVYEAIRASEQRMTIKLGGMLVVGIGAIAVLMQLS